MAAEERRAQTGEKRRHSTRLRRESTVKRQAIELEAPPPKVKETPKSRATVKTTSDDKPKPKPAPAKPRKSLPDVTIRESPAPKSQSLPAKIRDGEPLPTRDYLQRDDGEKCQSMKESGVLAAALARSRKRWITDGVLDKYWSKPPPKKKGTVDVAPLLRKAPGEKAGSCTLTAEPHNFDVTLYIVRENLPPTHPQYHQYAAQTAQPQQQPRAPSQQPPQQAWPVATPAARIPSVAATPTPPPQSAQPDPVIHMLAQRASTNAELKSVMKIVATGGANQQQLDFFQKHIDELTRLAKQQQEPKKPPAPIYNQNSFQHQPYHAPQRPVQAAPPAAVRINAVLIEFVLDTNSRFLFPPMSILEYGPGFRSCTASFLIKRKVSQAEDIAHYRQAAAALNRTIGAQVPVDDMVFWQPVTIRFVSDNGNTLEMLARVVKPPNEVKAWMERVLSGEPEETVKPSSVAPIQPAPAADGVKQEHGKAPAPTNAIASSTTTGEAKERPKYPPGAFRADSRKLALRLPKEDKGKENEGYA